MLYSQWHHQNMQFIFNKLSSCIILAKCFPRSSVGKDPPAMQETLVLFLGWEDPLEKGKTIHSSILAWRIPRTIESVALQRVGHD